MNAKVRFLHTSDWQLGMPANYLGEEARPRFSQARIDAIRRIGQLAESERCEFIVVAGDVFDSNQLDRRTISRAMEALGAIRVPVFLLPGNHDPLDAASIYRSRVFKDSRPPRVHVLEDGTPIPVRPGVEVFGAPWASKRPLKDLVFSVCSELKPGALRICVGHGAVDTLSPDPDNPALIRLEQAERALQDGHIHYLALGDRHSLTNVGKTGRIWYSGAPEPTDYDEVDPGFALVVDVGPDDCKVEKHLVGTWHYTLRKDIPANGVADLDAFQSWLTNCQEKERTLLKLAFVGTLPLRLKARLDGILEDAGARFASITIWERHDSLIVVPDDEDFSSLQLSGFALSSLTKLRTIANGGDAQAVTARNALMLLTRLSRRA